MAKRKARTRPRKARKVTAGRSKTARPSARSAASKAAARKRAARKRAAKSRNLKPNKKMAPKSQARSSKRQARKDKNKKKKTLPTARAASRKGSRQARAASAARKTARAVPRATARPKARTKAPAPRTRRAAPGGGGGRGPAPGLERPRRTLDELELETGDPDNSPTLDSGRYLGAARTGRAEMAEHLRDHTESSPDLTAGDVDADWAHAYDSGDEAPGGDNPTPDQDVVDQIGHALGVDYDEAESLKSDKVTERDHHRWEYDPASSEDYPDRDEDE